MATRSATINVMIKAADKASRRLKRDFGEVENLQVSRKGPADFVSAADLRAEQILRQDLGRARPETLGAAARIPGVTPAAVMALLRYVRKRPPEGEAGRFGRSDESAA